MARWRRRARDVSAVDELEAHRLAGSLCLQVRPHLLRQADVVRRHIAVQARHISKMQHVDEARDLCPDIGQTIGEPTTCQVYQSWCLRALILQLTSQSTHPVNADPETLLRGCVLNTEG